MHAAYENSVEVHLNILISEKVVTHSQVSNICRFFLSLLKNKGI